ncbi:MAG TPA: YbjN domain-containing protein [Polyangiaceae bacterium]|jgi:hypothetical protein
MARPKLEAVLENEFVRAKKLVEQAVRTLGLDPAAMCAEDGDTRAAWTLKRGSASVLVSIARQGKDGKDDTAYLRVAAPVIVMPEAADKQLAVCRRLLELNAGGLSNAAFGLVGDRVIAVSERPTLGLDGQEVEQMVRHLAAVADTFDDRLASEFGVAKA